MRTLTLKIECCDPTQDQAAHWKLCVLTVPRTASLLSVLRALQGQTAIAFRWGCNSGVCGACGMMVNGVPKLACQTLSYPDELILAPLAHFPVRRDLVVDLAPLFNRVGPSSLHFIPAHPHAAPAARRACIGCGLCCAACPQFGLREGFAGPAAITLAHGLNKDASAAGDRAWLNSEAGVWGCTAFGACSDVCPQQLDPSHVLLQAKVATALRGGQAEIFTPPVGRGALPTMSRWWWLKTGASRLYMLKGVSALALLVAAFDGVFCFSGPWMRRVIWLGCAFHAITWYQDLLRVGLGIALLLFALTTLAWSMG